MNIQLLDIDGKFVGERSRAMEMIDNYIYLYHLNLLVALPLYPESINDNMPANFQSTTILSRSAPIWSYSDSGPRTVQFNFQLHRDMMSEINSNNSTLLNGISDLDKDDYTDILIKNLQAMALPSYAITEKMVDPPIVAVRIGNDIFCKGVVNGGVSVTYNTPVLSNGKYAVVDVSFTVTEVEPYDAEVVAKVGSFRGLNTDIERNEWKKIGS
jgi:hypothetical protein